MNQEMLEAMFDDPTPRKGYVSANAFHRYINEVVGLKLGRNAMYSQLESGEIFAIRTGVGKGSWQVPLSELEGPNSYEARKLARASGKPAPAVGNMLGQRKATLNG